MTFSTLLRAATRHVREHWSGIVILVCATVTFFAVQRCQDARAELASQGWKLGEQRRLTDSTVAELAATRLDRDKLRGLLEDAEDSIHGKLIAGLRIRVPKRDTVIVYDTLETTVLADSTRVAYFEDSTFAGTISGKVTAPPFPASLVMDSLRVERPEFSPAVGFYQLPNGRHVAVVTWQGEKAEIEAPFVSPTIKPQRRVSGYVEGELDPFSIPTVGVGADARLFWGLEGYVRARHRFAPDEPLAQFGAGLRKRF